MTQSREELQEQALKWRLQAAQLLREASRLDGMRPLAVVHSYRSGESVYLHWAAPGLGTTEEDVREVTGGAYDPDDGDGASVCELGPDAIDQIAGAMPAANVAELVEELPPVPAEGG